MASSCILFDLKKKGRESPVKFSSAPDVEVVEPQNEQGYLIGLSCTLWGACIGPTTLGHQLCPFACRAHVPLRHHTFAANTDALQHRCSSTPTASGVVRRFGLLSTHGLDLRDSTHLDRRSGETQA